MQNDRYGDRLTDVACLSTGVMLKGFMVHCAQRGIKFTNGNHRFLSKESMVSCVGTDGSSTRNDSQLLSNGSQLLSPHLSIYHYICYSANICVIGTCIVLWQIDRFFRENKNQYKVTQRDAALRFNSRKERRVIHEVRLVFYLKILNNSDAMEIKTLVALNHRLVVLPTLEF